MGKSIELEQILDERETNTEKLKAEAPVIFEGFNELLNHYYKPGALDTKQKELMAIVGSVITRCVSCLANHIHNAIIAGATKEEIVEAAAIGVDYGGGASYVMVRDHLLDFIEQAKKK
jgi:AhpD family alkylhydroperoxidase